jgi:hypothetical protein
MRFDDRLPLRCPAVFRRRALLVTVGAVLLVTGDPIARRCSSQPDLQGH